MYFPAGDMSFQNCSCLFFLWRLVIYGLHMEYRSVPCHFCHMSDLLKQYLLRSKNIFSASSSELSQKLILISPYLFSAHAEKLSAFFVLHALPSFADKNCFFLFPAFKKFKSRFSL